MIGHGTIRGLRARVAIAALVGSLASTAVHAQTNAFVVSTGANRVTVIDTATATVRGAVTIGTSASRVAASPDGAWAYVSHPSLNYVSEIDAAALTVRRTIPTGSLPGALAVTPNGQYLYVATAGAVQVIDIPSGALEATVPLAGSVADFVFTPDGGRLYVAAGLLSVVDTVTRTAVATAVPATSLAIAANGSKAYVSSASGLFEVDLGTNAVSRAVSLFGTPGALALTPDGSRLYVGVQGFTMVSSSYGTFQVPFSNVTVFETGGNTHIATIGSSAVARMAVTPNRADLYMVIPTSLVSVASVNTNRVRLSLSVGTGANGLAITPDPNAVIVPYVIDAVDDRATTTLVSNVGGTPIANVLVNDTLGGVPARFSNVTLSQVSDTGTGVSLNVATGAVVVEPGASAGPHAVVYEICEVGSPANCDRATASLTVRDPYLIDAVDDSATTNAGKVAVNVLSNDRLNGLAATTGTVRLTQLATTHMGVTLASSTGGISVAPGTPTGTYMLSYWICEIASLTNCDEALATITVIPYIVDAVNDSGATTRSGGTAVANVLANDKFGTGTATLSNVRLTLVASSSAAVTLNLTTGAVTVASGTVRGVYTLAYRICEIASPANCDEATVTVTVNPYLIDAVNDVVLRASSKVPNTALASVLANDTLGGHRATTATVRLSQVSLTPANKMIRLDLTDGSVDVLGKTDSGSYSLVYRICEVANPTNCDQATVSLYLSGSGD